MPAIEPLCRLVGVCPDYLSREENIILEVELFARVCEELKESFKLKYRDYFQILKSHIEMENVMEENFVRCVINDILSTEEYTLDGIACYTQTPEEVVYELATGANTRPSAVLLRKIIELHRSVRRDLYDAMMKKISTLLFVAAEPERQL
jgi:hypothetical protein